MRKPAPYDVNLVVRWSRPHTAKYEVLGYQRRASRVLKRAGFTDIEHTTPPLREREAWKFRPTWRGRLFASTVVNARNQAEAKQVAYQKLRQALKEQMGWCRAPQMALVV